MMYDMERSVMLRGLHYIAWMTFELEKVLEDGTDDGPLLARQIREVEEAIQDCLEEDATWEDAKTRMDHAFQGRFEA